jgi:excisionase family DNA binding protein
MATVMNRALLLGVMSERRWGQSDLARAANIPQSTISRLLSGAMEPSGATVGKLLDATGLSYDRLFTNDVILADQYLTTTQVAERLGTSRKYIHRLVWRGELNAIRMGQSSRAPMRFTEVEVSRFLSKQPQAGRAS